MSDETKKDIITTANQTEEPNQVALDDNGGDTPQQRIIQVNIEEEMKTAYIDYSMSVIVSRALPDVRDGLKPVHRRILYGMANELGLYSDKTFKKSARIVGEVMGKFHPHGDSSVYDAMVRMAQEWSLRYQLVDGQGNFGSVDGDSPAAMRYTEARMRKITDEVMADIDKKTVDFKLNFDDTMEEPTVLPTRIPLLLLNGASGIAVGMATNMAPHNLTDTISAVNAYIDNPDIEIDELIPIIKAPDFPTGGIIYGYEGVKEAYHTGRGRVVMRSKTEIEYTTSGRVCIIVKEIPYQVNKAEMISKIGDLINDKKIEGISYINDESDRNGMRIVMILKQDAIANVVLNNLFRQTAMQSSFSVNNIALVEGRPRALNLKDLIKYFVRHRHDVVYRRTQYELSQAEGRAHIVEGLMIAQDNIDEVIALIRAAANTEEAKNSLMERFSLSPEQVAAIVEMRLRALTGLERNKLQNEWDELQKMIAHYKELLDSEPRRMQLIKDELLEIQERYGDERRTEITFSSAEFNPEDFYADEEVVITISHLGYIKRTPLTEYRTQSRGGVGSKGSATRDEDFIEHLYVATMHNTLMLFTEKGKCFWLKVYEIPEGTKISKGRAIQNVINIEPNDKVRAYINVKKLTDEEYINSNYIVMCTKEGLIKKTKLSAYSRPRSNGVIAINFRDEDQLIEARLTSGNSQVVLASRNGKSVRFDENDARAIGRTASGVRGINLADDDSVIGMLTVEPESGKDIFVVTENGMGKRTDIEEYRLQSRGGKGVKALNVTEKTGKLISIQLVNDEDDLIIINRSGITIRTKVSEIRQTGRATQGVKVINLRGDDTIASVIAVPRNEEEEEVVAIENTETTEATTDNNEPQE